MNYNYTVLEIIVNFKTEWSHMIEVKDVFFLFPLFQASYNKCERGREGGTYRMCKSQMN